MSLRGKLMSLAMLAALGTLSVGAINYWGLHRVTQANKDISLYGEIQRAQMDADMMHDAIRGDAYGAVLAARTQDLAAEPRFREAIADHIARFKEDVDSLARTNPLVVDTDLKAMVAAARTYSTSATRVVEEAFKDPATATARLDDLERQYQHLLELNDRLGEHIMRDVKDVQSRAASVYANSRVISLVALLAFVSLSLGLNGYVGRRVTMHIREAAQRVDQLHQQCILSLGQAMAGMARGDLSHRVQVNVEQMRDSSDDELGRLTRGVNAIVGQSRDTVAAFDQARSTIVTLVEETRRLAHAGQRGQLLERGEPARFEGSFRDAVTGINDTLNALLAPVYEASQVLDQLAQRDLTARVKGRYEGDHATIQRALNEALDNLAGALSAVATSAQAVAVSSEEIGAASRELASGAADQAAALEEVAGSTREMAIMTKRNASNAVEGRALADAARASTAEGVEEVQRLAAAIARIRTSAEDTAKIVKTIDEIAFQTNLLALNAAVEAARAGDSGRGFAVVADEVRNLAMRSAEAARTSAQLIEESVKSTEAGVAINNQVLARLAEIDQRVNRVGQVVTEIAGASGEQARGVEIIDRTLDTMSRRTQEVAASADESERTAQSLGAQSQLLAELVAEFRLGDSVPRATAHAAPTPSLPPAAPRPELRPLGARRQHPPSLSEVGSEAFEF